MTIYAISDIHGYYSIYEKVKAMLKPEDVVYFLGDAGDRGPQSWETITAIYTDPQFIYLKGNHEDMLIKFMEEYYITNNLYNRALIDLRHNGGINTVDSWLSLPEEERKQWYENLKDLPVLKIINNRIYLCHAGFTPDYLFKDYLWDRKHYYHFWPEDKKYKDIVIIHGHTPVWAMDGSWENDSLTELPVFYADNHKINIDLGVYETKKACLLNLETMKYHIIEANK